MRNRFNAVALVDAAFIVSTKPGKIVGDIFKNGLEIYAKTGFPEEWKKHHQGGLTGYAGREFRATEYSKERVELNQLFAWNPSIAGAKSEDTIIQLGLSSH